MLRRRLARSPRGSAASQGSDPIAARGGVDPDEVAATLWFHSIDFGDGLQSKGIKSADALHSELEAMDLPDLTGRTVLDIGAWDGYFSFAAERRGAARVVALDHYAWAMDHAAQRRYWSDCHERGVVPRPPEEVPEIWRPDVLPGKAGFDLARRALSSKVEPVVGDFMTMDLKPLGTFDVVLFLGVLYHLKDPFLAVRRLARVTAGTAVLETVCAAFPGLEGRPLLEFFETDELSGDPSNWWGPNAAALTAMCRAAGFDHAEMKAQPPPGEQEVHYGRAILHATRRRGAPRQAGDALR